VQLIEVCRPVYRLCWCYQYTNTDESVAQFVYLSRKLHFEHPMIV